MENDNDGPKTFTVTEEQLARMVNAAVTSQLKSHKPQASIDEEQLFSKFANRLMPQVQKSEPTNEEILTKKVEAMEKREREAIKRQQELESLNTLRDTLKGKVTPEAIPIVMDLLKGRGNIDYAAQTIMVNGEDVTYQDAVSHFVSSPEAKFFLSAPQAKQAAKLSTLGGNTTPHITDSSSGLSKSDQFAAILAAATAKAKL